MPSYSSGETVVRKRYWTVPVDRSWRGEAYAELLKAIGAAESSYRQAHGLSRDHSLSDDALWVSVTDDAVVISYTTEELVPRGDGHVQCPGAS